QHPAGAVAGPLLFLPSPPKRGRGEEETLSACVERRMPAWARKSSKRRAPAGLFLFRRGARRSATAVPPLTRYLRRLLGPASGGGLTDAQLVERFVAERDEAAFEVLLWRHGPMVLAVCRRLLRHEQDAEDAFQATFLVLARKAASIGRRQAVGAW